MEESVSREVCEAKMQGISDSLTNIESDTTEIKEMLKPVPFLCEKVALMDRRVSILEDKFDRLLTGLVVTVVVGILVFIITKGLGIGG